MFAVLILLLSAAVTGHAAGGNLPAVPTEDELSTSSFEWSTQKYCARRTVSIDEKTSVIRGVSTETREYDAHGRLLRKRKQSSDGANLDVRFSYDQPSTVREEQSTGDKITYHLDENGRLASLRHARGETTVQVQRDVHGHLEGWSDGKLKVECQLEHDGALRLTSRSCQLGRGETAQANSDTFTYDRQGLLIGVLSDDGVARQRCAVVRREDGRPVAIVCRRKDLVSSFRTLSYDGRGNLVEELEQAFPISPVVSRTTYDYSCWPATTAAPKDVEFVF